MDKQSTFALVGIPETLAITFVLVWLSLTLAPWVGGMELGPLKVPRVGKRMIRWLKFVAPAGLLIFLLGFVKVWPKTVQASSITYGEYIENFYHQGAKPKFKGELFVLNELEIQQFSRYLGSSSWDGGPHWGKIVFEANGRLAHFTNKESRSAGRILIQGVPPGTIPIMLGEWHQEDGQSGRIAIPLRGDFNKSLRVSWGPGLSVDSEWTRMPLTK